MLNYQRVIDWGYCTTALYMLHIYIYMVALDICELHVVTLALPRSGHVWAIAHFVDSGCPINHPQSRLTI